MNFEYLAAFNCMSRSIYMNKTNYIKEEDETQKEKNIKEYKEESDSYITDALYCRSYLSSTWSVDDLSKWDVSKVTDMSQMFSYAGYNTVIFEIGDLGSWTTETVPNMSEMFGGAGFKATTSELDLSEWDVSKVKNMHDMFY